MLNKIEEYKNIDLQDKRLNILFIKSINKMSNSPSESLPSIFENIHQTKGLYRLLDNKNVPLRKIEECNKNSVYERIEKLKKEKVILAVQDTSDINYSRHSSKKELGPTQNGITHGLKLHPTLVLTKDRILLGVIHTKMWTKDPKEQEKKKQSKQEKDKERASKPIEEKESFKWIESMEASIEFGQKISRQRNNKYGRQRIRYI